MTEDEAKTKWCPHASAVRLKVSNDDARNYEPNCIASDCMMWVEVREPDGTDRTTIQQALIGGHCGLITP